MGAKFQGLTNSYMTDQERASIDVNGREHYNRVWGSKIQILGWSLYACILWSLKFCVTAFYGRLTCVVSLCENCRFLTLPQHRTDQPQNSCASSLHHSRCHICGRCPHDPTNMPSIPSHVADHAGSWSSLPTDELAGECTSGVDSEHIDGHLPAFHSFACK